MESYTITTTAVSTLYTDVTGDRRKAQPTKEITKGNIVAYTSKRGRSSNYKVRWIGYNKNGELTVGLPAPYGNKLFYVPAHQVRKVND